MSAKRFVAHSGTLDNLAWMQSRNFAEAGRVVHYGENPGCGDIRAAGMIATLNILNDATLAQNDIGYTATGSDASYIQSIVNNGYSCIAGEGTGPSLVGAIMGYAPYINYGGDQQNEMYAPPWNHPTSGGKGHWDYIETYTAGGGASQVTNIGGVEGCINAARSAGAGHLGILIGEWCSAGSDTYVQIVDATGCDTICSWGGYDGHSSAAQGVMGELIDHYGATKGGGGGVTPVPTYKCWNGQVVATAADCPSVAQIYGGSTPACCALGGSELAVFVRGTTGNLYMKEYFSSAWHPWVDVGGTVGAGTGPGVASWGGQRLDMFVGGGGGAVYHKGGTTLPFGAWENLGGKTTGDCGACSTGNNDVYVFVRGGDGALWCRGYYSGAWHPWYTLGGKILPGTGPAACSWGGGELDVFVTGTNNCVYHMRYSGSWGGWQNMGGVTSCTPGCATPGHGAMALFVRDNNEFILLLMVLLILGLIMVVLEVVLVTYFVIMLGQML